MGGLLILGLWGFPMRLWWPCSATIGSAAGWTTAERSTAILRQFHLSGRKLDEAAPGRRQGRMASGRTLSARRLHRNEHGTPRRECHRLLRQARHVRAVDQRRQTRDQVDA